MLQYVITGTACDSTALTVTTEPAGHSWLRSEDRSEAEHANATKLQCNTMLFDHEFVLMIEAYVVAAEVTYLLEWWQRLQTATLVD